MKQVLCDLPVGWTWITIGQRCGKVTDGSHNPPKGKETGQPMLSSRNVLNGEIVWDQYRLITNAEFEAEHKRTRIADGDILLTIVGTIGRSTVVRDYPELFTLQRSVAVLSSEADVPEFISYQLRSPLFQEYFSGEAKGAAQKGFYLKQLKNTCLALPPLNEQKRIVAKLDALFTRIDTAISHLQETLELSKALFASETSIVFDQISNKYGVTNLSNLVQINSGIALPKIFKDWKSTGSIPFYKVAQMNNDDRVMKDAIITFDSDVALTHKIKLFPKGSVLIPKRGGAILTDKKRLLLEDASYDSNVMGLKADEKSIIDEYLFRFMLSINLGDYVDTSSIPQLNNKHIDQMQIPLAPLEEQKSIVTHLDALAGRTRTLETATKEKLSDLTALKASLLDAAFKGQL